VEINEKVNPVEAIQPMSSRKTCGQFLSVCWKAPRVILRIWLFASFWGKKVGQKTVVF